MDINQILALSIFIIMFVFIILDKWHRCLTALVAAIAVIGVVFLGAMHDWQVVLDVFNLRSMLQGSFWLSKQGGHALHSGINWQTIIFITGMMIMAERLASTGLFRWMCLYMARLVKCNVPYILVAFILLSGLLSMFIDSITVLLFLTATTVELSRLLKFNPIPMILAEIFASNVGGLATMSGDPPNIIIGTSFGYSFSDFLVNTGPIAIVSLLISALFFFCIFRKELRSGDREENYKSCPYPASAISNLPGFISSVIIFLVVIILLITHEYSGLSVALIGIIAALLSLCSAGKTGLKLMRRLDWRTLLFFVSLFIVVGGLEQTGVLEKLASLISNVSGGNLVLVISMILWISALASSLVDNIPFTATMVPVIRDLAEMQGLDLSTMSWALALGTNNGGNATPIGASSNVVGTAIAEKSGHPIKWGYYMKYSIPASLFVLGLCQFYLLWRYA